jgi:hypothetical protein
MEYRGKGIVVSSVSKNSSFQTSAITGFLKFTRSMRKTSSSKDGNKPRESKKTQDHDDDDDEESRYSDFGVSGQRVHSGTAVEIKLKRELSLAW